jgi:hypothetical protein
VMNCLKAFTNLWNCCFYTAIVVNSSFRFYCRITVNIVHLSHIVSVRSKIFCNGYCDNIFGSDVKTNCFQ